MWQVLSQCVSRRQIGKLQKIKHFSQKNVIIISRIGKHALNLGLEYLKGPLKSLDRKTSHCASTKQNEWQDF